MTEERGRRRAEEDVRESLEDDEPAVQAGETGVGQTRRFGTDAGAAQGLVAAAGQAPGVAPVREGSTPLPPENRRPGEVAMEGDQAAADPDAPATLDPSRTIVDRNAAGGSWAGTTEVVESDYETEQLRARQEDDEDDRPDPDEGQPHERVRGP